MFCTFIKVMSVEFHSSIYKLLRYCEMLHTFDIKNRNEGVMEGWWFLRTTCTTCICLLPFPQSQIYSRSYWKNMLRKFL